MLANTATPIESKERIQVRNWTAQENCSRTNLFILDIISVLSLQKSENQLLRVKEAKETWRNKSRLFLNIPCEICFWMPYDYIQAINVHNSTRGAAAYIYCTCLKTITSQHKISTRIGLQMSEKIQSSTLRKRSMTFSSYHLRRKYWFCEHLTGINQNSNILSIPIAQVNFIFFCMGSCHHRFTRHTYLPWHI